MNSISFFRDLLNTILSKGLRFSSSQGDNKYDCTIGELCNDLLSSRGEASGTAIAHAVLQKYAELDENGKEEFFRLLAEEYDVDLEPAKKAISEYEKDRSSKNLKKLINTTEPRRQELIRRLNMCLGGTARLVDMRAEFLGNSSISKECERIDLDFKHLFSSWFNKGFLVLRRIDWTTPAHILEKIIKYEAVHEIGSWEELRARLEPEDRRCFAFFHPVMPDDPLIFVEIALTKGISTSIQEVLASDREAIRESEATTAVFYSISNCQKGLKGVSFGNFLIKQVAMDLAIELPNLKTFTTLSPIPGFMKWLMREAKKDPSGPASEMRDIVSDLNWNRNEQNRIDLQKPLMTLAAQYFLNEKRRTGEPIDPVARFHLGNGASLKQINWLGDTSAKGLGQSAGLMVNYLYELSSIEENHEAYVSNGEIKTTGKIRALLPAPVAEKRGTELVKVEE
ncbi:MAG: malonyl-CoA decarboxylase [Methyloligellaceae bacterium]